MDPRALLAALDADGDAVLLRVRVQPNASRSEIVGPHGDALKVRVTAPPEGGRANEAVVGLVAQVLSTTTRHVSLVRGERSRVKVLRVAGLSLREVVARLVGLG